MAHMGDFDTSTVVYGKFTTYRPSTGAAFTLGGTPALSVYKDNSTTQSTTGVTLTADFDSVTGLNHFAIDTSADGTFYAAGSFFDIVITTGTVDSVSVVGSVVGSFTLRKNSALKPTTAARTLDVSAGGEAGVDWANVGSPTTSVNLSGTTVGTASAVTTVNGLANNVITAASINADAITAAKIANGAIDAATFAADVDAEILSYLVDDATRIDASALNTATGTTIPAILTDTAEIGAAGAGLTALASQTSVNTIDDLLDTEIAALTTAVADLPTNAELATALGTADDAVLAAIAALNNLSAADVNAEVDAAISDAFTFSNGNVNANVEEINTVTITGDGQIGTEFGVA